MVSDYWRVPLVAMAAALIAFMGSFVVSPTYAAGTSVLIRARDTSVLSADGTSLNQQPGVVDSQLATALSDTQIALLGNRQLAERVVDRLHLDSAPPRQHGLVAAARGAAKAVYKRTRAYLTYGYYKQPDRRSTAIAAVQAGLSGEQVHSGFGLNVIAASDSPKLTADIANAAADALVAMSQERFTAEATAQQKFLKQRVTQAVQEETVARNALARYKTAQGLVTTPEDDARLLQQSQDQIALQIRTTQAEYEASRAEVSSLRSQLQRTDPSATTDQRIVTGRSKTDISTSALNPAYSQLLNQVQAAQAQSSGLAARLAALRDALNSGDGVSSRTANGREAELSRLQLDVSIATGTRSQLANELQQASMNAARPALELTRLDSAAPPTYPVGPKRYLFLAVGLLLGALGAFIWSFLKVERRRRSLTQPSLAGSPDRTVDLSTPAADAGSSNQLQESMFPAQR
jgi:uncharacterized protein involved in exopolysaccharide biosynthesis